MTQDIGSQLQAKLDELREQHLLTLQALGLFQWRPDFSRSDEASPQKTRAKDCDSEIDSYNATYIAFEAFERLLTLAETRDGGQISRVVQFLAWVWGAHPGFKLDNLKSLDRSIGDDMLMVLNAIRWSRVSVHDMAMNDADRVSKALQDWGYLQPVSNPDQALALSATQDSEEEPSMATIKFKMQASGRGKGTDIEKLRMLSPAAANLTATLLGMPSMVRDGKPLRERIDEWMTRYRAMSADATLSALEALWRDCPSASLPERAVLMERIKKMHQAGRPPSSRP